jgi:hypothetical protein
MSDWIKKMDSAWIGFFIGLTAPIFVFLGYWLFFHHGLSLPRRFLKFLIDGYMLSSVIKMCGLINLLVFYGGLHFSLNRFNKGIIFSLVIYMALIAYVTYYLEPEYI